MVNVAQFNTVPYNRMDVALPLPSQDQRQQNTTGPKESVCSIVPCVCIHLSLLHSITSFRRDDLQQSQ